MNRYDAAGNADPNGAYDVNGDLIGAPPDSGSPTVQLTTGPAGGPPPAGTNSVWSTLTGLLNSATGAYTSVQKTLNSSAIATAQTNAQIAAINNQPNWTMWAVLALIVVALILWLK